MKKLSDILGKPAVRPAFSDNEELTVESDLKRVQQVDTDDVLKQALGSPEPDSADAIRKIWSGAGHF